MQLVNSGCLNMFYYVPSCWLQSSFLESLALLDSLLYPTENELSGSRNWKWNIAIHLLLSAWWLTNYCKRRISFKYFSFLAISPWWWNVSPSAKSFGNIRSLGNILSLLWSLSPAKQKQYIPGITNVILKKNDIFLFFFGCVWSRCLQIVVLKKRI